MIWKQEFSFILNHLFTNLWKSYTEKVCTVKRYRYNHVLTEKVNQKIARLEQFCQSDIRPTQLLNCQWNSSGIDGCQVLKYQSSQSIKV